MTNLLKGLIDIAGRGGRASLIDTKAEKDEVLAYLAMAYEDPSSVTYGCGTNASDLKEVCIASGIYQLMKYPDNSFQINPGAPSGLKKTVGCNKGDEDCFKLLIPVESFDTARFPVYSGGVCNDYVNYFPISEEEWQLITFPLSKPATSVAEERDDLIESIDIFMDIVADSDVKSDIGNVFWWRGQMDCVDTAFTVAGLLYMLSSEGYLRNYKFDPDNFFDGIAMVHFAATISGPNGTEMVDAFGYNTVIQSAAAWKENTIRSYATPDVYYDF